MIFPLKRIILFFITLSYLILNKYNFFTLVFYNYRYKYFYENFFVKTNILLIMKSDMLFIQFPIIFAISVVTFIFHLDEEEQSKGNVKENLRHQRHCF